MIDAGDYVEHLTLVSLRGVRGQVLWTDGMDTYVCWETGYEYHRCHHRNDLKKLNVLDLIIAGREVSFEHCSPQSRCKCGVQLQHTRKSNLFICPLCSVYYNPDGSPHVHSDR